MNKWKKEDLGGMKDEYLEGEGWMNIWKGKVGWMKDEYLEGGGWMN